MNDRKVTLSCEIPAGSIEEFSHYVKDAIGDPAFSDLTVKIVKKAPPERRLAPSEILEYIVSIIIIIAEGPDAAKKLNTALRVLKTRLDSRKIKYEEKSD